MTIRKLAASAAAIAMLATSPAAAQGVAAQHASNVRTGAALQHENELEGMGVGAYIIGAIVIGLAIWGIIELTKDDNDEPTSP